MFAHRVIEDLGILKKICEKDKSLKHFLQYISNPIPFIKSAQKFHIGDVGNYVTIGKAVDMNDVNNLKLPYSLMYIDGILPSSESTSRVALLISKTIIGHDIMAFNLDSLTKTWIPSMGCVRYNEQKKEVLVFVDEPDGIYNKTTHEWISAMGSLAYAVIMLLNCKNISTEKIVAPQALNKKRRKNNKQEIFDYHVLNVIVPSNNKHDYQEKSIPLSHNRVHLCRGHFKKYTAEHPLFGKYTGLYWWQPSVRGQNKDGIVIKDYSIKTIQEEAQNGIN